MRIKRSLSLKRRLRGDRKYSGMCRYSHDADVEPNIASVLGDTVIRSTPGCAYSVMMLMWWMNARRTVSENSDRDGSIGKKDIAERCQGVSSACCTSIAAGDPDPDPDALRSALDRGRPCRPLTTTAVG
jgi:hypothetical protein